MAAEAIDWAAAVRSGQRLAPTGPDVSAEQARQAVQDLQQFSAKAELIVRDTTGLGHGLPVEKAFVVDRPHWIEATAQGMAELTAPLAAKLAGKLDQAPRAKTAAGAQLGVVLSFLSSRVLGQYDPLAPPGPDSVSGAPGRLLLVAPNIIKVERELHADPVDFRMWVCLHESTHRLQFTAVPWLREHFRGLVAEFGEAADTDASELLGRIVKAVKGGRGSAGGSSWIETVQTPEQRLIFDKLMALMTLLEGHADHVMDAVGPTVIPSVGEIRKSFTLRRKKGRGPFDRILRSLLGMDMKMAQYVKGAAFVSAVVDEVGMDAFNTIWTSPETLPTRAETTDPKGWIDRVLT
ncbi:coenzyme F420 biosynthesis associated uncharacterized protein [Nakamurella sp. UYEF19]|uniref:zinc-dependent metalloprotease n=1 Tax=Nakamurella sp. UYEF19 TaxID=1756392 RepID=UPI0033981C61